MAQYYHDHVIVRGRSLLRAALNRGIATGEFARWTSSRASMFAIAPLLMLVIWRYSFCFCGNDIEPAAFLQTHVDLLVNGLLRRSTRNEPPETSLIWRSAGSRHGAVRRLRPRGTEGRTAAPVLTMVVGATEMQGATVYAGEVRSRVEQSLGFRIAGKVSERPIDAGAVVRPGQVLARLDPVDTALSAGAADAQRQLAEGRRRTFRE